ncbi:hypothetical protein [Thiopseudomonas acetoxidans]|uniref:Uncharacterized protein n=1 Tax=Thiopseudomonas acetoxidans TaxID=3041622 RepID=A0ABT7SPS2_9GAMM|nr:hypothetical protein [Thiopseudomonas sp. CY1220]MDM7858189.1 hypothetical protein [Thiopseudomonas sp. CY1220]
MRWILTPVLHLKWRSKPASWQTKALFAVQENNPATGLFPATVAALCQGKSGFV